MTITKTHFGTLPDGKSVNVYTLCADSGLSASILTYGATIQSLCVPDAYGTVQDVVLGFDTLAQYLEPHPYFGAAIGRVANRISGATFTIDGQAYPITANEGRNTLHGGPVGFDRVIWDAAIEGDSLILSHISPDGHQGFPGTVHTSMRFHLDDHSLHLDIRATTTRPTPLNLSHHSYFNLTDGGLTPVADHSLQVLADHMTPVDDDYIPTGTVKPVTNTVFDMRKRRLISDIIRQRAEGLDHNYLCSGQGLRPVARLSSPSGRQLTVHSSYPALQVYTGNTMGDYVGKNGIAYNDCHGVALEPQYPPNAVNIEDFPDIILRSEQPYHHVIVYQFSAVEDRA